jgi:hypothetical protein
MWVTAVYHQVSLFSLKPSDATSTGGKSLLVPTPYSIKMALLDAAIRTAGVQEGSRVFPLLRDMAIAISPPPYIIVNNCFVRVQKPRRSDGGQKQRRGKEARAGELEQAGDEPLEPDDERASPGLGTYIRSVAFREYVQYSGPLGLAVEAQTQEDAARLHALLPLVNYLGKRGGFFQLDCPPTVRSHLPVQQKFLPLSEGTAFTEGAESGPALLMQFLDDWHPGMTFDQVNVSSSALAVGRERLQRLVQLPYRLLRSSHGFTLYERTDIT